MVLPKYCPIENTLKHIGKKWTMNILRDMFRGKKRFKDFLAASPKLSTKMLSLRLKEMEKDGIIEKNIVGKSPVLIEYCLTEKGKHLNKVLYELYYFSTTQYPEEIFDTVPKSKNEALEKAKTTFNIK